MPRGRRKQPVLRHNLSLVLLIAKFILIKIGLLPLSIIKLIKRLLVLSFKLLIFVPKVIINFVFYKPLPILSRKGRGRPRKRVFLAYFFIQLNRFIKKSIPGRVKLTAGLTTLLILFTGYTAGIFYIASELPNPHRLISPIQPLTTEFYDRNGVLLYRLYEGRNRTLVKLEDIPKYVTQSTLAIEDKNFYHHFGIDPIAIFRAAYKNYHEGTMEGASTLTQQLVKNSLLSPEKTYERKIKEIVLAFWAERLYSKDTILQMYLNEAPYGGPTWGIEAAAQTYFGKSAKELTLAESAFLAGLPASPSEFSPYGTAPSLGKLRQKEVLRRMIEENFITQAKADKAYNEELNFIPPTNNIKAPHFVMYVRDLLSKQFGSRVVSQGGLKVYTTLDLELQEEVQNIVSDEVDKLAGLNVGNGSAMVVDPKNGQILAMIGSKDYRQSGFGNFNVTLSLRQPGSSIKPITFATAFKKGYNPGNTILDVPINFKDEWGNGYSPVNYDGTYHGPISIRTALGSSYNIPAVKVLAAVGVEEMAQTARDLGITTINNPKQYGLALTLGAVETRMIDMMAVYSTFSQLGVKRVPNPLLKVIDSSGNLLTEYEDKKESVLQPEIAYLITDILSDNKARTPAFGPKSLLHFEDAKVAVKTGTSDSKRDNWTFGYTSDFVVGVWVGNNNNTPMNPALASGITGAAPIWNRIITGLLKRYPHPTFARPSGIIEISVDGRRDLAVAGLLPKALVRTSQDNDKTYFFDSYSSYATSSATAAVKNGTTN